LGPVNQGSAGSTPAWLRGDGETWQEWQYLEAAIRAAPECMSRGSEIDCFAAQALSLDSTLGHLNFDGEAWGEWESLGGAVRQKPACLVGLGQQITCVALGADAKENNGLWYYQFDGQDWQPATLLTFPSGVTATLRPMCTDTADGTICFEADSKGQLWAIRRDKDGAWGDWEQLARGVGIAETPHCLSSGKKLDCFSKSANDKLIAASFDGKSWSQWLEVGEATVRSQPYCNKLGSGFDCYWTTPLAINDLRRRQLVNGTWLPEENLAGSVQARTECLATPSGQRIDCFVQGIEGENNDTLQHLVFD
jgi:hypothetical protein